MAFFAANSPPPPAPLSLISSEGLAPLPPPIEKKKKKGLVKTVLKELSGGDRGEKIKGAPVVRPYGRGGVGVKPSNAAASKASLGSSSSLNSPPPSLNTQQPQVQINAPQPTSPDGYYRNGGNTYDPYANDDAQSTLSTIPPLKRTEAWLQNLSSSNTGDSASYLGRGMLPSSPPTSQYPPSTNSREEDYYAHNQQPQYQGGYAPRGPQRLQNVTEGLPADFANQSSLDEHFRRMNLSPPRGAPPSLGSRGVRSGSAPTISSFGNPPRSGTSNGYYPGEDYYGSPRHPQSPRSDMLDPAMSPGRGPNGAMDPVTAQAIERYLAAQGINVPSLMDNYASAAAPTPRAPPVASPAMSPGNSQASPALQQTTQQLQSQIEKLREAERLAREKLEDLRKGGAGASSSATRKDHLDVMGSPNDSARAVSTAPSSSAATSASAALIRNAIVVGQRRSDDGAEEDAGPSGATPTQHQSAQDRALIEKEKLRQRDMEREREMRIRQQESAAYHQHYDYGHNYAQQQQHQQHQDPFAALMAAQQAAMYQQQQQPPQNMLLQALAAQQMSQNGPGSPPLGATSPFAGGGDVNQQQLIMQLGTLLLQTQQQLQMLSANRSPGGHQQQNSGGIDMNTLLALASPQANLAAMLQQQQQQQLHQQQQQLQQQQYQQQQQLQRRSQSPPMLTTTAPSLHRHGTGNSDDQRSQSQLSSLSAGSSAVSLTNGNGTTATTSNSASNNTNPYSGGGGKFPVMSMSSNPSPTPPSQTSSTSPPPNGIGKQRDVYSPQQASHLPPARIGSSFGMQSFSRELGLAEEDRHPNPSPGSAVRQTSLGSRNPPRTSPPRVPLPELPRGRSPAPPVGPRSPPGGEELGPSTPPPAYMSTR